MERGVGWLQAPAQLSPVFLNPPSSAAPSVVRPHDHRWESGIVDACLPCVCRCREDLVWKVGAGELLPLATAAAPCQHVHVARGFLGGCLDFLSGQRLVWKSSMCRSSSAFKPKAIPFSFLSFFCVHLAWSTCSGLPGGDATVHQLFGVSLSCDLDEIIDFPGLLREFLS